MMKKGSAGSIERRKEERKNLLKVLSLFIQIGFTKLQVGPFNLRMGFQYISQERIHKAFDGIRQRIIVFLNQIPYPASPKCSIF